MNTELKMTEYKSTVALSSSSQSSIAGICHPEMKNV